MTRQLMVPREVLILQSGPSLWLIGPRRCYEGLPDEILIRRRDEALQVLRRFTRDDVGMAGLRELHALEGAPGISVFRLQHDRVIDQIAAAVASGTLCLAQIDRFSQLPVRELHDRLQALLPASEAALKVTRPVSARVPAPPISPAKSALSGAGSVPTKAAPSAPNKAAPSSSPSRTAALPAAPIIAKPVSQWSLEERFFDVLKRTEPKLPSRFQAAFAELLSPAVAATLVGTLVLIATAQIVGGLASAAIDTLLIGIGFVFLGWAAFEAGELIGKFIYRTATAGSPADLDAAADALAQAIVLIGVQAVLAVFIKAAAKAGNRGVPKSDRAKGDAPEPVEVEKPKLKRPRLVDDRSVEPEQHPKIKSRDELAKSDRETIASLVREGRIEAARDVLRPFARSRDLLGILDRLDVASAPGKSVFWSGDKTAAEQFASKIGGVTLETTPGGRVVDGWNEISNAFPGWKGEPPPNGFDFWTSLSKKFADGASGDVNVVQTTSKAAMGGGDVWRNVEQGALETLQDRGVVGKIIFHTI